MNGKAKGQMPANLRSSNGGSNQTGRRIEGQGEALTGVCSDQATPTHCETLNTGQGLLEAALERSNLQRAFKRVRSNKGTAGVDGLDIDQTAEHLKTQWPRLRQELLEGRYKPSPVRRVRIPKPDGSWRELGIPTVTDRLIQQALLQILQPLIDPTFSEHSHGFRPGRGARDAILRAQQYVQSGKRVVVDVDLEKFFDRVNHDILMARVRKRIGDPRVVRLIRAYLNSGIMDGGIGKHRMEGTPQGGPLSPLLANMLLDEVDKELERRGHCFVRYADDCNVYVGSQQAGYRVMTVLTRLYGQLKLKINESKSAVASAYGRKFLGYAFWAGPGQPTKRAVATEAIATYKQRVRELTRRNAGRSMQEVRERLRQYVLGWKAYFGMSQTPSVFKRLDEWMRHRLRAIQLKHWRRGATMYRELKALGASHEVARRIAANSKSWWRNSAKSLNAVLTIAYFDRLGCPRLTN